MKKARARIFYLGAVFLAAVVAFAIITSGLRRATAEATLESLLASDLLKNSVRIDGGALDKLYGNCISRDYTIRVLRRVIELESLAGAPASSVSRADSLLQKVPRCGNRKGALEDVRAGRWIVQSGAISIKNPRLREALLHTKRLWEEQPTILASYIQTRLTPLKDGPPTRSKLTEMERLHSQFPDNINLVYNLMRFYVALREYESYRRLMTSVKVRRVINEEKNNENIRPLFAFSKAANTEPGAAGQYQRAAYYFLNGDVDNAEAICADAIEQYPNKPAFYFLRALALHGQGRHDFALEMIRKAVELDPRNDTYSSAERIIANKFDKPRPSHPVILCYHRVSGEYMLEPGTVTPQTFEQHLRYLNSEDFADASVCPPAGGKSAGRPSVGTTIDDGYEDAAGIAWPLLKKYRRAAAFFIVAGRAFGEPGYMDISTLKRLRSEGLRVGLHTMSHSRLRGLGGQAFDLEINLAKWLLERGLGAQVRCFAYTYGAYSQSLERKVRAAGLTETYALDDVPYGAMPYRRIPILHADSLFLFQIKLYGLDYDAWLRAIRGAGPK